jgi:hypothetical protein
MKSLYLSLLLAISLPAQAYLGTFDPQPLRNEVEITFIDSQFPGPICLAAGADNLVNLVLAPMVIQVVGCAIYDKALVVVPISVGPGQLYALHVLSTPDGNLGHETRHIFDGQFHVPLLSFIDIVRNPDKAAGVVVSGDKHD